MLAFRDSCILQGGVPVLEGSIDATDAARVALVGDWSPLFRAALGEAELARGEIEVFGQPLEAGLRSGRCALAPLELPSLPRWTAQQYLDAAASLGPRSRPSVELAREFGLAALLERKLGEMLPSELRAIRLLVAAVTRPELVLVETPFAELDEVGQGLVQRTLERLAQTTQLYVSFPADAARVDALCESPAAAFFRSCAAVWVVDHGRILTASAPLPFLGSARRFRVSVLGPAGNFARRLEHAGAAIEPVPRPCVASEWDLVATFVLTLTDALGSREVLHAAAEENVLVVEWVPLLPALDASPGLGA